MSETNAVYDFDSGEEVPGVGGLPEPAAFEGDVIRREATINVLVEECRQLNRQIIGTHFEIGRRLADLRELAEEGRWLKILNEIGYTRRFAYNHLDYYEGCKQLPGLKDMAERNYSKALALFQSMDTEDVRELIEGRLPLLTLDDVDKLSVPDLKKAIHLLTAEKEKVLAEETKNDKAQITSLIGERDALRGQLESDADAAHKTAREVRDAVQTLVDRSRVLIAQIERLDLKDARQIQDTIQTAMANGKLLLDNVWADWVDRADELGLGD